MYCKQHKKEIYQREHTTASICCLPFEQITTYTGKKNGSLKLFFAIILQHKSVYVLDLKKFYYKIPHTKAVCQQTVILEIKQY